jgi:hypothetical protein
MTTESLPRFVEVHQVARVSPGLEVGLADRLGKIPGLQQRWRHDTSRVGPQPRIVQ